MPKGFFKAIRHALWRFFIEIPGNDRHGNPCFCKASNHWRKTSTQIGKTTDSLRASSLIQIREAPNWAILLRVGTVVVHARAFIALAMRLAAVFPLKISIAVLTAASLKLFSSSAGRFMLYQKSEGSSLDHDS